ncbi:MAG: helix-turn-helix transcriptional regulator [Pseudomonadota bacterium]
MEQSPLKAFRAEHGFTQTALGVRLGLPEKIAQARISHYESGRSEIPREIAYAFIDLAAEHDDAYSLEDLYPRPKKVA